MLSSFMFSAVAFAEEATVTTTAELDDTEEVIEITFSDVSPLNPHRAAIDALVAQGVLEGFNDGSFRPDQDVTRAEAVKIILLGLGVELQEDSTEADAFSDVSGDDWFYTHVGTAVSEGIVEGYDDNTFRPAQNVNRAEALKIAAVAAGVVPNEADEKPFEDVNFDAWFIDYAAYAKDQNIVPAQFDGLWHGETALSRAKISELVYRMQQVKNSSNAFDESTHWLRKAFPTVDVTLKVPFGWNMKGDGVGALWLLDAPRSQFSMLRPYDNGGTLLMTRYSNAEGLSESAIFNSLHDSIPQFTQEVEIAGYPALVAKIDSETIYKEWFIYLPNQALIHLQGLRGSGLYSDNIEAHMELVVNSLEYEPAHSEALTLDEKIEAMRTGIQVDGTGEELKDLLDDWTLLETDSIGVGTGPVDYFYSPTANITIKYERSFDVILDLREGETSAF